MADIEFMDPPPKTGAGPRPGRVHAGIAAQLRTAPGRWARVQAGAETRSLAGNITCGRYPSYAPAGAFEASTRKSDTGDGYDIYARYIGENGEQK